MRRWVTLLVRTLRGPEKLGRSRCQPPVCTHVHPKEALGRGCSQAKSSPRSRLHRLCGSKVLYLCSFGSLSELTLSLGCRSKEAEAFHPEGMGLFPMENVSLAPPVLEACKLTPLVLPMDITSRCPRFGLPGERVCSQPAL